MQTHKMISSFRRILVRALCVCIIYTYDFFLITASWYMLYPCIYVSTTLTDTRKRTYIHTCKLSHCRMGFCVVCR